MFVEDVSWLGWFFDVLYELVPWTPSWSDVAGIATACATLGLFAVAWVQLHKISDNQRRWATLQACDRYDTDPTLVAQRKLLRERLRNSRFATASEVRFALNTLLNYFDAIAIGIDQKLYFSKIAEKHLGPVVRGWLDDLADTNDAVVKLEIQSIKSDYSSLCELYKEWFGIAPKLLRNEA
jgi:hypothetical protein